MKNKSCQEIVSGSSLERKGQHSRNSGPSSQPLWTSMKFSLIDDLLKL